MSRNQQAPLSIVVIGGSLGAIESLGCFVPALTRDLPAAYFVVVHLLAEAPSLLPQVLGRMSPTGVSSPRDGETIRRGCLYVAPPDYHLTLEGGKICVQQGPRENSHRPAIDPLFRTAARNFGPNVIAVLLSGCLDDGSAGMMAVRNRHGIGIIQNPDEAIAAEMPRNALKYAGADYILSAKEIGPKLTELIKSREAAMKKHDRKSKAGKKSRDPEPWQNETVSSNGQGTGKPSVFACPECHGVLWEIKDGKMTRFRCRVGHAYGATSLKSEIDQSTERALWAALRSLEEKASMRERLVDTNRGSDRLVRRFRDQISADRANADLIRKMILAN